MTTEIMDYLGKAEGKEIHYNKNESDITSPYGIYRSKHPDAEIFKEIDRIAGEIGISLPSSSWSKHQIDIINSYIKKHHLEGNLKELASDFYDRYFKSLEIEIFPEESRVTIFSLYTNSELLSIKSIQNAINTLIDKKYLNCQYLVIDGIFGNKSKSCIREITKQNNHDLNLLFESYCMLFMSFEYSRLAYTNPDKYLRYLHGWDNRLKVLLKLNT